MSQASPQGRLLALLVGRELRGRRRAAGLSLSALEARTGVQRDILCMLEHGRRLPTLQTLDRYAAGVGADLVEVLEVVDRAQVLLFDQHVAA